MRKLLLLAGVALSATLLFAQHPRPQPRPAPSVQTRQPDGTIRIVTPESPLPAGRNFLLTVDSNMFDGNGREMANTEPSRPNVPYNLQDGNPAVSNIDPTSPTDDLKAVFERVLAAAQAGKVDTASIQLGLDILEGNPIASRPTYSGMALLHYTGGEKIRSVTPDFGPDGKVIGGNVFVHQVWFDINIESDVALLDPSLVQDVPWTITYTVDVLHRGADDFAPFTLFFDAPPDNTLGNFGPPHIGMDQTFFPMQEGTRTIFKIKMPPAKYLNLIYTWGWRRHPPRVQVMENSLKEIGGKGLYAWEADLFGRKPRSNRADQLAAIAKIGELAPAKKMWQALMDGKSAGAPEVIPLMRKAVRAYRDWTDRNALPEGVTADPNADLTLFYVNNTIYGNEINLPTWTQRPGNIKVTLKNGDHFVHGYINVDFGGSRGWENQFQSTVKVGGTGCSFTFGRAHWWMTAGGPGGLIDVPPVDANGAPGVQKLEFVLNFDPSTRIKFYQFDPYHHDVAVYSLH
ncbi:MAG TPA: hypothetical protein VGQ81_01935 [Acidobacteriota bacterium]|nr:hypothetical protein [Acidobacteriota bacterium]